MSDDGNNNGNRIADIIEGVLDRNFVRLMRPFLAGGTSPALERRVRDLQTEAERLDDEGKRLDSDNPFVVSLQVTLAQELGAQNERLRDLAGRVQQSGVESAGELHRRLSLGGVSDDQLARIGMRYNIPDPDALEALVDYVNNPAFRRSLDISSDYVLRVVNDQIIRGVLEGRAPMVIAEILAGTVRELPVHQVNTMMRTLQLESYRQANYLYALSNRDIIRRRVRIGTLDERICMACLALHGTEIPWGETVRDHHAGRCTEIDIIIETPDNRVQTGEVYFAGLSDDAQRRLAGDGAYEAIKSGRAGLRDFVVTYEDDLFGTMIRKKALRDVVRR